MTQACPSLADLGASERSSAVNEHIDACRRCQTVIQLLERGGQLSRAAERDAADGAPRVSPQRRQEIGGLAVGSIWALSDSSDEFLVAAVVDFDDQEVVVVPVSDAVEQGTEWDLLMRVDALGYEAIAQVWNHGAVLVEQLVEQLGILGSQTEQLETLYSAALDGLESPPDGLPVGVPVLSQQDPRLLAQGEAGRRALGYWSPALALAGVSTLGELVANRCRELSVAADEFEVEPAVLAALEGNRPGVLNDLPASSLAAILRRLGVGASRRLGQIATATARATYREPIVQEARMARRRRGSGVSRRAQDARAVDRFAEAYARDLLEELSRAAGSDL